MKVCTLSTKDNPYNPFTQWDQWNAFDTFHGYYSNGYLARIAKTSIDLSPEDQALEIERAVDEIVALNLTGNYIKVTMETE